MYDKYAFEKYENKEKLDLFNKDYIDFLSECKNERLVVRYVEKVAREHGFKSIEEFKSLKKGDKVFIKNRNKNIVLFVVGKNSLVEGLNV